MLLNSDTHIVAHYYEVFNRKILYYPKNTLAFFKICVIMYSRGNSKRRFAPLHRQSRLFILIGG